MPASDQDGAPGETLTLYAGNSPSFVQPPAAPAQVDRAAALGQKLTATSTISVTYHGFSAQAKLAFQAAVDVWQSIIVSSQVIHVDAHWTDLGASTGILGQAGSTAEYNGGDGFWYAAALAEARCSCEVNSGAEIEADFNSAFSHWYLGTHGNVPSSQYDFETVVLHELGHGLGFYSSFNVDRSSGDLGRDAAHELRFDANEWDAATGGNLMTSYANNSSALESQLTDGSVFLGGTHVETVLGKRAKLYAPNPWQEGSSNSHLDESKYAPFTVNALMTPILYNGESIHDPGPATKAIFQDIGWAIAGASTDTTPPSLGTPKVNLVAPQVMHASVSVRVSWPDASDPSGIASYELQWQQGAGPWTGVPLAAPTSTSAQVAATRGSNGTFRVRATDGASNTGSWSTTPTASVSTVQETSGTVAYSGTWAHSRLSGSTGRFVQRSSSTNATATFSFNGTSVALVTSKAAARGVAQITLDGTDVGTVDLYATSKKTRKVAWASDAALAPGSHTLVIRVTGTKNSSSIDARIDIDAFLVWP